MLSLTSQALPSFCHPALSKGQMRLGIHPLEFKLIALFAIKDIPSLT